MATDEASDRTVTLARQPENPQFNLNLATILRRQQRWADAARRYETALRGLPNETGGLFDLGYCYEQLGRDEDAIRTYRRYIAAVRASDPEGATRAEERVQGLGGS